MTLDAHAKPPARLREVYKEQQLAKTVKPAPTPDISPPPGLRITDAARLPSDIRDAFDSFVCHLPVGDAPSGNTSCVGDILEVSEIPGLFVYPSLLPPDVQLSLLDKLLHRDVADPKHHTNVHLFHHVAYPPLDENGLLTSFFDPSVQDLVFTPIDPAVHKPFSMQQFWNKKLRWVTLGGQYDWTNKVYPQETPPAFPSDIKQLLEDIFPIKAEAAILNLYSPGDTLSLHRDVSEECNRPLVSISLGCDAIFIVGLDGESPSQEPRVATLRLRSGDAVLMSGASRFAWHGVPKVVKGTCPEWMQDWPGGSGRPVGYQKWKGWMTNKRINLNVRQMFADSS